MSEETEVQEGWEKVVLTDLFIFEGGGTPDKKVAAYWGGDINWASVKDIKKKYLKDTQDFITREGLGNSATSLAEKGEVILITRISPGATTITKIPTAINQDLKIVKFFGEMSAEFIYYLFKANLNQFLKEASGTTVKGIKLSNLADIEVGLPPLNEQHRIVEKIEELLSDLDDGVADLKRAQRQLKVYRQALLKDAFEGKLTNIDSIIHLKLGEVCDGVEYGSSSKSKRSGSTPVLRMGNIQSGKIDWEDLVYTSDDEEIDKYLLKNNDVLFNRTNSPEWVGKTAIYKAKNEAIFAGYLIRIKYKKDKVNPDYLNYYLNSQKAREYGNGVKSFGVNQSNINGTKLKNYPFPYTEIDEQNKIVELLESNFSHLDNLEKTIGQSLTQAEALRQSILKKAFAGKLVPQDAADEPASQLLKKIKLEKEKYLEARKKPKKKKAAPRPIKAGTQLTIEGV